MKFYKYQGTGNDFVIIDNRKQLVQLSASQVAHLCDRRMGIGADGLMLLETADGYDFRMVYYNADGNESTMCGNGGRCLTAFAQHLGIITNEAQFTAIDGAHRSEIHPDGLISLHMQDVPHVDIQPDCIILNTGSPHYVKWVQDIVHTDVFTEGRTIRQLPQFAPNGINVNFVQKQEDRLLVRTYERGVEEETLSCGTGVTAAAIAATGTNTGTYTTSIETPGGLLSVSFTKHSALTAENIVLTGPAQLVYEGEIDI